jgi:hypothetical protein
MGMLDDLGAYLDTNSALTLGTDLFLGILPETPSNCVALFENSGVSPDFTLGANNLPILERPELQVIVRNASYSTGNTLADTIYRVFTQITNQSINSVNYLRIQAIANPSVMDRDSNRRVLFTTNFRVIRVTP